MSAKTTLEEKYWARVVPSGPDQCWEWLGRRRKTPKQNYGRITIGGKSYIAHRIAYELFKGPIPRGYVICHKCDNPPCVNPNHLFIGTDQENQLDCTLKGRRPRGEKVYGARLVSADIPKIRDLHRQGYSNREIGIMFGVAKPTIQGITSGRTWKHI